jgi:predicted metalloendopeptidase
MQRSSEDEDEELPGEMAMLKVTHNGREAFVSPQQAEPYPVRLFDAVKQQKYASIHAKRTRCGRLQIYFGWCFAVMTITAIVVTITWQSCGAFTNAFTQLELGNGNFTEMVRNFRLIAAEVYPAMNQSADVCEDAYNWGCGGFIESVDLGTDRSSITKAFYELDKANLGLLLEVIDDEWPTITPYFRSCNESFELGNFSSVLMPLYQLIYNSSSKDILFSNIARLRNDFGVDISGFAFDFQVSIDVYDPTTRIPTLWQGGVTLPGSEYYAATGSPIDQQSYLRFITSLFSLSPNPISSEDANSIFIYERTVSGILLGPEQFETPAELYNKVEWTRFFPMVSREIATYANALSAMPASQKTFFNLGTPSYFVKYADVMRSTSLGVLKNVALYTLFKKTYALMATQYYEADRQLSLLLNGISHSSGSARELGCLYTVVEDLELLMGHYFVQKAGIDEVYKEHVAELIELHVLAFENRLKANPWMDASTRISAQAKLEAMRRQVCYPDDWSEVLDFEQQLGLPLSPVAFFNNSLRIAQLYDRSSFAHLGKLVDPNEWSVGYSMLESKRRESPEVVNAFYSPDLNRITIPAGIARPPFLYSYTWRRAPLSAIYGGLGTVIGHEITHGFDNQGRKYGPDGGLLNWWTSAAEQQFSIAAQCIATSRSMLETQVSGLYVNGLLTLGENIADLGGIETALDAMLAKKATLSESELADYEDAIRIVFPALDDTQLFYLFFIQNWCAKSTNEAVHALVASNPHAPAAERVKGTLRDTPRFATAFGCSVGSEYSPRSHCSIW